MIFHAFYCKIFTLRTPKEQEWCLSLRLGTGYRGTYGGFEMGTPHNGYIISYKNKANKDKTLQN